MFEHSPTCAEYCGGDDGAVVAIAHLHQAVEVKEVREDAGVRVCCSGGNYGLGIMI